MLSGEQIVEMAQDQGKKARKAGYTPYLLKNLDVDTLQQFPFPNLGSYVPSGWELKHYFTVDATGMGYESEPALTIRGLKAKIKEFQRDTSTNWGAGIIEAGEFQVVVGFFAPDSRDFTHTGSLTDGELKVIREH